MTFITPEGQALPHSRRGSPSISIVLLGLAADTVIALLKFAAARESGATALFTEGVHSLLDVLTEVILLYGLASARRPADRNFQLGYGRSAFFWNLIAAMLILALGAGFALREGWHQYAAPQPLGPSTTSFVVLLLSFLIDGSFAFFTCRKIVRTSSEHSLVQYLRRSRDGATLTVLFTSFASLAGILIAALGTLASTRLAFPAADGIASLAIALMMAATALLLANESRSLIIGASASPETERKILALAATVPEVAAANGMITVHIGPGRLVVSISIAFRAECRTQDIERAVVAIEERIKHGVPQVSLLLVKPQSAQQFQDVQFRRGW
ncbi:cation diffusion facilitator family transporter [Sphingomonas kyeonggiensis]|uniref:cation diffusion facilitator family transporter n=1 Tax=Sphingomonas kyeonggiensis TaxID=1268553 RepID=UPI00278AAE85|nr:cation diffusion facilitator family transporter [Sphingomonas kyeonggiensis]MDQ0248800.1 cation diffusion facilitator family transporter [Sphingomonas kyeonggiensis]